MNLTITTEPASEQDLDWVCRELKATYWGNWLNDAQIKRAIDNSLCFWMREFEAEQCWPIGFARVVTDHHIISTLTDCLVIESHRGMGYGKKLMEAVIAHPSVARTICILGSRDAPDFYKRFGFAKVEIAVLSRDPS